MTITDVVQLTVFPPSENPAKEITVWFVEILSYQSLLRTVSHKKRAITYLARVVVDFPRRWTFRLGQRWPRRSQFHPAYSLLE